jgi:lipopolysaccharide export system protein LptC
VIDTYRLYPILALALLAGGSLWLERITRVDESSVSQMAQSGPDFTAEQTRVVGFGNTGKQRYELLSERLQHFPQGDITRLQAPQLRMINDDGRETVITAATAEVSPGGERVDLAGDVRVRRPGAADEAPLALDSETLTVWPDSHRAETDSPVLLMRGLTRANAQGMRADNLFGTLELSGEVRTHMPRRQGSPS